MHNVLHIFIYTFILGILILQLQLSLYFQTFSKEESNIFYIFKVEAVMRTPV